jgi:HAE1 family hydrophobic/amphiphilic exporter-1
LTQQRLTRAQTQRQHLKRQQQHRLLWQTIGRPRHQALSLVVTGGEDGSLRWFDYRAVASSDVLPDGVTQTWSDVSYQEKVAPNPMPVFAVAIFLVFLVLAAQYESWTLPFSVLLGTPFAVFGAFFGLWAAGLVVPPVFVNNIFAQIGLIMLIGLAAKNAILIVEFARMLQQQGRDATSAVLESARLRFRPILMTAFAFILGVVPLLTASGAGAFSRKVMGMAVFSGMIVATLVGLILIPALFVLIDKISGGKKKSSPSSDLMTNSTNHPS